MGKLLVSGRVDPRCFFVDGHPFPQIEGFSSHEIFGDLAPRFCRCRRPLVDLVELCPAEPLTVRTEGKAPLPACAEFKVR